MDADERLADRLGRMRAKSIRRLARAATGEGQATLRRLAAERLAASIPEDLREPLAALEGDERRLAELVIDPDQSLAPGALARELGVSRRRAELLLVSLEVLHPDLYERLVTERTVTKGRR